MLVDEISMLKAVMVKLDESTAVLVTLQHHSEAGENGHKFNREKSMKRWIARVDTIDNFKKLIKDLAEDAVRLDKCVWPGDKLGKHICMGNNSTNARFSEFLETKLKKIKTWDEGLKVFDGWQTKTPKRQAGYNLNAKYDTEDYLDESGAKVSLRDKDALLKRAGTNLTKSFVKPKKQAVQPAQPATP